MADLENGDFAIPRKWLLKLWNILLGEQDTPAVPKYHLPDYLLIPKGKVNLYNVKTWQWPSDLNNHTKYH